MRDRVNDLLIDVCLAVYIAGWSLIWLARYPFPRWRVDFMQPFAKDDLATRAREPIQSHQ